MSDQDPRSDSANLINFESVGDGKHEVPVRRSSRLRQPNIRLDEDDLRREKVISLGRSKSGTLGAITTKRNEIERLMLSEANSERAELLLSDLTKLFRRYEEIHERYVLEITDKVAIDNANQAYNQLRISISIFEQRVSKWLSSNTLNKSKLIQEQMDGDSDIQPNDSVSQTTPAKGSYSCKSSHASRASSKSSISTARIQETVRLAELQAEVKAFQQRKTLKEKELKLKEEELKLSFQREQLDLETEVAKARARETVFARVEAETHNPTPSRLDDDVPLKLPPLPNTMKKETSPNNSIASDDNVDRYDTKGHIEKPKKYTNSRPEFDQQRTSDEQIDRAQRFSENSLTKSNSAFSERDYFDKGYRLLEQQGNILEELIVHQNRATLPRRQMFSFGGEVTEYRPFIRAFEALIEAKEPDDASKLYYLEQYTMGRVKELVRSCQHMEPREGYAKARSLLEEKYGQKYKIAMAHVERLVKGPPIKSEDADALEGFSILLTSCFNTLKAINHLNKIENPDIMKKIIERLPYKLQERWRDVADNIMNNQKRDVTIEDITTFVTSRARSLSNPVFGKLSVPSKDQASKSLNQKRKQDTRYKPTSFNVQVASHQDKATETDRRELRKNCVCCGDGHELSDCKNFEKKFYDERLNLVKENYLCFACLKKGHQARNCFRRKPCKECYGKHSTLLHTSAMKDSVEKPKEKHEENSNESLPSDGNTRRTYGVAHSAYAGTCDGITVLPIVPVKVKKCNSQDYIETYALLDSGSSSTFCTESLRKKLEVEGMVQKIRLTTLGTNEEVTTQLISGLEVSDLDENRSFVLRDVLCRPNIPVSKHQIPTQEDVDNWPYLEGKVFLPRLNHESCVDLLIGSNAPEILQPKEIVHSQDGGPYASRTEFGWVINGPTGRKPATVEQTNFFVKTETNPMCHVCTDFIDNSDATKEMSQDDLRFMDIVERSVRKTPDEHYEISLPVKDPALKMPNNRAQALKRMGYLKGKFEKNPKFHNDYCKSVTDILEKGQNSS